MRNEGLRSTDCKDVSTIAEEGLNIDNGDNIVEVPRTEDYI
jgi:hypothetical protein